MDLKSFGKRLKETRKARGLTADALSEKSGLSTSYIRQIEAGTRQPRLETLSVICNTLNVSPEYLMSDSLCLERSDKQDELIRMVRGLTAKQAKHVADTITIMFDQSRQ